MRARARGELRMHRTLFHAAGRNAAAAATDFSGSGLSPPPLLPPLHMLQAAGARRSLNAARARHGAHSAAGPCPPPPARGGKSHQQSRDCNGSVSSSSPASFAFFLPFLPPLWRHQRSTRACAPAHSPHCPCPPTRRRARRGGWSVAAASSPSSSNPPKVASCSPFFVSFAPLPPAARLPRSPPPAPAPQQTHNHTRVRCSCLPPGPRPGRQHTPAAPSSRQREGMEGSKRAPHNMCAPDRSPQHRLPRA